MKKTDFTRHVTTRTLSKINKRNSVCERMLVDSTSLAGWPIDHSSSVILKKSVLKLMDHTVYGQLQMHTQGRQLKPKLQYNGTRLTAEFAMLPKLSPSRILPPIHLYCTCTATCINLECISEMHSTLNVYFFKNQDVRERCTD